MKIRVLEVLASLRRAGAERVAVSIATGLDTARFETGVVSLYDAFAGGFEPVLEARGVPVWHLGKRHGFDPRMWPRVRRVVREFRPDIVHTHSYVMRYVLPARPRTLVHSVQNVANREVNALGRLLHRLAFRGGAVPVAVSKEVARSFQEVYGFPPPATILNGAEIRLATARAAWRQAHGFSAGDLILVSVARLEPQKNPIGLIDAFARALPRDSHLVMAGDGSLRDTVREHVARLGVSGRVHLLGLCADIPELLSACDLFALASHWEGMPLAVVEAMAAGLPVLATAVGGVPEIVEDGVTGVLLPAGDTAAFAAAMEALARDPELRRAMGRAGAARAGRFSSAAMITAYAALFERLCRQRP